MSNPFLNLYQDARISSGNIASAHGVLTSICNTQQEALEELLLEKKILKDEYLRNKIERTLRLVKRSRKIAEYYWEHRSEKEITWEEASKAADPVTVA